MSNKLYVGNLPYDADESALRTFFGNGHNGRLVTRVRIASDPVTGQRRGFAFVELNTPEQTSEALATLNGKALNGRAVVVRLAHPSQSSRAHRPAASSPSRRPEARPVEPRRSTG